MHLLGFVLLLYIEVAPILNERRVESNTTFEYGKY